MYPPPNPHTHSQAQKKFISVPAAEAERYVVVEIESSSIRKPFVGGYRHKVSGLEYHHAFTQTPLLHFKVSAEGNHFVIYDCGF
jgi:hypothetical protein